MRTSSQPPVPFGQSSASPPPHAAFDAEPVEVPRAGGLPYLGLLTRMRNRPLEVLAQAGQHGDVVLLGRTFKRPVYLVRRPEYVCEVLRDRTGSFRMNRGNPVLRALLGDSMFMREGDAWLTRRRMLQPVFRKSHLPHMAPYLAAVVDEVAKRWDEAARDGRVLELGVEMTSLALRFIVRAMFGVAFTGDYDLLEASFRRGMDLRERGRWGLLRVPLSWPTPRNLWFWRNLRELEDITRRIITANRLRADGPPNLLDLLLAARDADGEPLSDQDLRNEVMTAITIGHVTTAAALTWGHFLIATHPEVEARLRDELSTVLKGRVPELSDLDRMPYLNAVLDETLRLNPAVWLITRVTTQPARVGPHVLPPGALLVLSQWVTHRTPTLWTDPLAFNPGRFVDDGAQAAPAQGLFPFGDGPRRCIGGDVAVMEFKLGIATLLQRFRVRPVDAGRVRLQALSTLKPRDGIPVRIQHL